MKIVEVVPISKSVYKETLSYFTSHEVLVGSVVSVPVRKKNIKALVLSCSDVSLSKIDLRSRDYSLKKVLDIEGQSIFSSDFMDSASFVAEYFASPLSLVLHSLIPSIFFKKYENFVQVLIPKNDGDVFEKYAIQMFEDDRFSHYKSILREQIAKGKSVFFVCPTSKLAEHSFNLIKKGIHDYCHLINSNLNQKQLTESINQVINSEKPVVVFTTPKYLSIPIKNIGAIVMDKENSSYYKQRTRPFIDFRVFVECFAKKIKAKLFLGDLNLRMETLHLVNDGEVVPFVPLKQKISMSPKDLFIDMKSKTEDKRSFKIVSPELEKLIKLGIEEKKKVFLFCSRKGLHSLTLCGDCGELVSCSRCSSPAVLHSSTKGNFFLCHRCGKSRDAEIRCSKCHSWKLLSFGIGLDFLEKKLKERFKNIQIFKIDGDSTPTPKKAEDVFKKFNSAQGGILIGTEMALNYLEEVPYSAVVTFDSFFSFPDFRINEKIINLVFSIKEKTKESFIVQTRNIEDGVFRFLKSGNLSDFYKEELKQRKELGFPPFSNFIKITFSGNVNFINTESEKLKKFFEEYELNIYPAFVSKAKNKLVKNALLKIAPKDWPDKNILNKLLSLPANFSIDVNPDNLL
jgi:primosomal protein N' (replication factor Y) (superfamily II helicase)